jgi:hypothetical protein
MLARSEGFYRFDRRTPLTDYELNRRFLDLHRRVLEVETSKLSDEALRQEVRDTVLQSSEAVIGALRDQLIELTQLQWLTGLSATPVALAAGAVRVFELAEEDRALFSPGPWVLLSREDDAEIYAVARAQSYDRETGLFSVQISTLSAGAIDQPGPWSDWVIASLAGSTLAQLEYLTQGRQARDQAVAAEAAVTPLHAEVVEARDEVMPVVEAAADTAVAARDAAQASAAAAAASAAALAGVVRSVNGITPGPDGALILPIAAEVQALFDRELAAMIQETEAAAGPLVTSYGFADTFADTSRIDLLTSTGITFDAAGQLIDNLDPVGEFPTVVGSVFKGQTVTTVVLPATVQAGDQLLMVAMSMGQNDNLNSASTPNGAFSQIARRWQENPGLANVTLEIWRRTAVAGDAGATVTVGDTGWVAEIFVIRGASGQMAVQSIGQNATASVNPPALAHGWGDRRARWLTVVAAGVTTADAWTAPANYSAAVNRALNNGWAAFATAFRDLRAESEDPAAWTRAINASATIGLTLAIEPVPSARAMDLRWKAFASAGGAPRRVSALFLVEPVTGALDPNVAFKGRFSRDCGDNWSDLVLTTRSVSGAITALVAIAQDVSGQPLDNDCILSVTAPITRRVKVHAAANLVGGA